MAGVRGVKNPMPTKGGKPTGIFSSKGSQKNDSTADFGHKKLLNDNKYNGTDDRCNPVKRDNMIKKGG